MYKEKNMLNRPLTEAFGVRPFGRFEDTDFDRLTQLLYFFTFGKLSESSFMYMCCR